MVRSDFEIDDVWNEKRREKGESWRERRERVGEREKNN